MVALIAGGLVVAFGGGVDDTIVPASETPQPDVTSPTTPDSTVAETVVEPSPSTTAETPSITVAPQVISVDAANPPPLIEPVVYASVPLEPDPNGNGVSVAIGPDNIVVKQPDVDFVSLIGPPDVTVSRFRSPRRSTSIVSGPGPVIYGLGGPVFDEENQVAPRGFRFLAVRVPGRSGR